MAHGHSVSNNQQPLTSAQQELADGKFAGIVAHSPLRWLWTFLTTLLPIVVAWTKPPGGSSTLRKEDVEARIHAALGLYQLVVDGRQAAAQAKEAFAVIDKVFRSLVDSAKSVRDAAIAMGKARNIDLSALNGSLAGRE